MARSSPLSIDFSEMNSFSGQVQAVHTLLQTVMSEEPTELHAGFVVRDDYASVFTDSTGSLSILLEEKIVTLEIGRSGDRMDYGSLLYHEDHVEEGAITRMAGHFSAAARRLSESTEGTYRRNSAANRARIFANAD